MNEKHQNLKAEAQRLQDQALSVIFSISLALDDGQASYLASLEKRREALRQALTEYETLKHQRIFDPVMRRAADVDKAAAVEMKAMCVAESENLRMHMSAWPADRIAREWSSYRSAARLILRRLHRHLGREAADIKGLLEHTREN